MANGPYPSVGLYWFDNVDPTVPPGMPAPFRQLLIREDSPELYYKSGLGDTDWTLLAGGGGPAGPTGPTGATGATGATGPDVTFTPGSIIFAGVGGELAADPTQLFWDNPNNRIGIGTNVPAFSIEVINPTAGVIAVGKIRASSNSGYSALQLGSFDPFNGPAGTIGYGNPGVADPLRVNRNFWHTLDDAGNVTDIVFVSNALAFLFHTINTEINLDMGSGVSAGLSTPNRGKLVYSAGGDQAFRVSCNGGVYQTLMTQSSGGAFTSGSVVFATGTGSFGQDNAAFNWNAAGKYLQLVATSADGPLYLTNGSTGYAMFGAITNPGGVFKSYWGFAGATSGVIHMRNFNAVYCADSDFVLSNPTLNNARFGMTAGSAFFQLANGQAGPAGLSESGTCRFKYNDTAKTLMLSFDGAAYVTVQTA